MDNAIRHNMPGGWVKLSASVSENLVHIIVQDSGKGIPEEHLEKVFDRFYKVEDGTRSAQKAAVWDFPLPAGWWRLITAGSS